MERVMCYRLEPAQSVYPGLIRKLTIAGMNPKNQWFFSDGAFTASDIISSSTNTWISEDFVVINEEKIIAFFSAKWIRPLDILTSLRIIILEEKKSVFVVKAFLEYLDYIFCARGCEVLNWTVAEKNTKAYTLYEKFISHFCGHKVGLRHHAQKSYTGEISDVILYELTREEYFNWKNR